MRLTIRVFSPVRLSRSRLGRLASSCSSLEAHPAVAWVRYPYLPSHPFYAAARRQMANGSGMMSFGLRASFEGARRIMGRLHLIVRAVSLGDAESLIMHPASLTRARQKTRPEAKLATGVGEDLVRMSIGLEDADDLLDDLEQALRGF
jgi:methionine-gamma-lyase